MKVEVLYKSHRYEEFDSSIQTCSEPYRSKGRNILTDWNLYLGSLEETGIVLVQHWYDGNTENSKEKAHFEGVAVPAATRKVGCALLLVSPDELDEIVWLKKDGEKLLWREGDDLINGERFFAQEQLCYSDANTISINRRALAVFDYLAHVNPDKSDDEIAELMGYTEAAINRIRNAESCQNDGFINDDEDDNNQDNKSSDNNENNENNESNPDADDNDFS